jgi:hypothetical protein
MRSVVIVSPQFPPSNLAGVHRARLLAMHLPKFGWSPRVLAVDPRHYEEPLDPELAALVPRWVEVVRTPALPTRPVRVIGDVGLRSLAWHYRALSRMARQARIDLLCVTIPPNFSAVLGPLLHRRRGVPYVVDYQDPWVHAWPGSEIRWSRAWLSFQLGRRLEPIVLRHARLLTGVAPGYYAGALERSPWLDPSRCVAMPLGAEEADFRYLDSHPRPPALFDPDDGLVHLVYAGAILPRAYTTLEALLAALRTARERDPSGPAARLRLHFVGTGSRVTDAASHTVAPRAERAGLAGCVLEHPQRLPYVDVLNHLRHAHAVLVLGSSEPHYTPSKVFQAVLSDRPVLALLHARSTAAGMLRDARVGPLVTFDDDTRVEARVDEIAAALAEVAGDPKRFGPGGDRTAFAAYSAEAMARGLAAAFDAAVDGAGGPGSPRS